MGVTAGAAEPARTSLGRVSVLLGWVPVATLLPIALLGPEIPTTYRYLPLVASVVVFGLPHGAVDYVALPRARTGHLTARGVAVVVALYLLLGGGYLALWFLAPIPAAVGFVLLTWFHWGQGDLYVLRDLYATSHVDDSLQAVSTVLVRGGLPMFVSLVGFPERYRAVVETFVAPFGESVGSWWVFEPAGRLALGGAFAAVTVLVLARGFGRASRDGRRGWLVDAGETGLLWAYFLFVPPVLAVGIYFCLWHSVRHIARVVLLDEYSVDALAARRWLPTVGKFTLEAAVPTALALALVGALWVTVPGAVESLAGATGLYLVAIAVLTLPHTAVVLWIDHKQGIWPRLL